MAAPDLPAANRRDMRSALLEGAIMTKTPTDDDIVRLARQAGLDPPDEFMAELIDAYGHVRQMAGRLLAARPHGDEPAHVFVASAFLPRQD
jgi:hypothetical protein